MRSPCTDHTEPTIVTGLVGATAIGAGEERTCAVAGGAKCWGRNECGGLGNGTNDGSSEPVVVSGLP